MKNKLTDLNNHLFQSPLIGASVMTDPWQGVPAALRQYIEFQSPLIGASVMTYWMDMPEEPMTKVSIPSDRGFCNDAWLGEACPGAANRFNPL